MKCAALLFISASLTLFSPDAMSVDERFSGPETTSQPGFAIPNKDLEALETKALDGDIESAVKLTKYYMLNVNDYEKTRYWMQIAAENGDSSAEQNLGNLMSSELPLRETRSSRYDALRSCFWIRKAVADGQPKGSFYGQLARCNIPKK